MPQPRLLLIDDEPTLAEFLATAAQESGFDPVITEHDEQFREAFAAERPDVVALDLGMPGMDGVELIRVRNMSAGGIMAIVTRAPVVGDQVRIELSSHKIPSTVVWTRDELIGFKFDQNVDLGELLAGRKPRLGFRARPPRLEIACKASVRVGKVYYTVDVHDISMGGMKVEPIEEYCVGKKVVVVVESLRPIKGEVRWYSDRKAGIVFDEPLPFEELAEWVGKRLELASLKASYQKN
jgi:CheY-like chemotaxis protein